MSLPQGEVRPGDFIRSDLLMHFDRAARRDLASTIPRVRLERDLGVDVPPEQSIVRPPAGVALELEVDPDVEPAAGATLHVAPGVEIGCAWAELEQRLARVMAASGADAVFPACNLSEPVSAPMPGDKGSPMPRMPGGRSVYEIDAALSAGPLRYVEGMPARPAAVLLRDGVQTPRKPVVCTSAYVWRGSEADAVDIDCGRGIERGWSSQVMRLRGRAAPRPERRPPVVLYSNAIGPWGGVAVLLRLADELQRLGVHAVFTHHLHVQHKYRSVTAPLYTHNARQMRQQWRGLFGRDALLVATSWGTGQAVAQIAAENPGVATTTFLQDREDLFERDASIPSASWRPYLDVGRGVAVSSWIIETAATEHGIDPAHYRIIPPGLDLDVFHPPPEPRCNDRVRVLAMWRPQTAKRRGVKLLHETYDALHGRLGDRVSLELFGWDDPRKATAPAYATHHGTLSQAEVADLMRQVDVVVEPSEYQGYGLPGVEAMACGAALVSTDCLGPRDYIRHRDNGLIVPHAELADAVAEVVEDATLRARLQAEGPRSVKAQSWPRIGARWALYLAELWQGRGGEAWQPEWAAVAARARVLLERD